MSQHESPTHARAAAPLMLPATLRLGAVHLTVSNLGRSVAFYEDAMGLRPHRREDGAALRGRWPGRGSSLWSRAPRTETGSSRCSWVCEIAFLDAMLTGGEHPGAPLSLPILRRGVEVTMYAVLCLLWQTQRDRIFALTVRMLVTLRAFVGHAALVVR